MSTKKSFVRKAHVRVLRNGRRLYLPPKLIQPKERPAEPKGKNGK